MGSYLLSVGSTVTCTHEGQAKPVTSNPRVKVAGQPVVTLTDAYAVASCTLATTLSAPPCVKATWTTAATRVKAGEQPVLLENGLALCESNGTPLKVSFTQARVCGI